LRNSIELKRENGVRICQGIHDASNAAALPARVGLTRCGQTVTRAEWARPVRRGRRFSGCRTVDFFDGHIRSRGNYEKKNTEMVDEEDGRAPSKNGRLLFFMY
jgi:hypothetical protein